MSSDDPKRDEGGGREDSLVEVIEKELQSEEGCRWQKEFMEEAANTRRNLEQLKELSPELRNARVTL